MLTIIVKGTNGCNLNCSYCSLGEKSDFKYINEKSLMSIMIFSCNLARYRDERQINFIFHGGEPTLVSPDVYDECISYINSRYVDLDITFSIQTNGFIITEEFIRMIKKHDINVGVSIDGSEEIHDFERSTINGNNTYKKITENIEKMLAENIQVSCLMVLTKYALDKNIDYLYYFAEKGIHLKVNPLLNYGNTLSHPELVLDKGDYAGYIERIYETIIRENLKVYVSPIDKIVNGIINNQQIRECSFDSQCNKHFLCIDYKGDIFPCGKFSDIEKMCIGNIGDTKFDYLESFLQQKICARRNDKIPEKCSKCQFINLCNAGCSAEAMIEGDYFNEPILCEDYLLLFKYFYTNGLRILRDALIKNKKYLEERI
ncbi:radical SAM protein [Agathobacter sp.]